MTTTRPVPADFDDFWRDLAARAHAVAPRVERAPTSAPRTELVRFTSLDGFRVGGWLVLPEGDVTSVVANAHGYGGRGDLELEYVPDGAAAFYPVARGLPELSLSDDIPAPSAEHVVHGIGSRDTYIQGPCTADLVFCAINALEELLDRPIGARRGGLPLGLYGGSFGGGIAAMAAPWDERIDAVALLVPSFGNNPDRLAVECLGSGAAVTAYVREHPEAWDVLDYFDAATAAARIAVPTAVAPAREDPAVPPVGQWAVAEAVPEALRTIVPLTAGHVPEYPGYTAEIAGWAATVRALFATVQAPSSGSRPEQLP